MIATLTRECLWCDASITSDDVLCSPCRAVNDHPPTECATNTNHLPTLGPDCAECVYEREALERRSNINAPIIAQLEVIRAQLVRGWNDRWPGAEHGKALVGMAIDRALKELK